MAEQFDVAILGAGVGGYVSAIRGAQLGLRVALIERDKVGGTCLQRGCIPTKSFLETAGLLARVRKGAEFGVKVEGATLDYPQVLKRTERVVNQLTKGVEFLLQKNQITLLRGEGRLTSPTSLAVRLADGTEQTVNAANLILATGSYPKPIPGVPFDGKRVLNSDHALKLAELPRSIVIVGAGAVGVEWASIYSDFGAEVTLVEMLPGLVPLEDAEIGVELGRAYSRRGIRAFAGAQASNIQVRETGIALDVTKDGKTETVEAEYLLVAAGRGANITGFGLEKLNVATERGFIKVDQYQRTSEPGVYAVGDAVGGLMLAHKAMAEGEVAIETIAGQEAEPVDRNRVPRVTFSRPEIASVGLTEQEAREQGLELKIGRFPFRANSKAVISGEPEGFAKMVSDARTGEILGVHLVGPHVTELITEPTLAKLLESTPWELGTNIHAHPTLSEVLSEAALDVEGRAIHFYNPPKAEAKSGG